MTYTHVARKEVCAVTSPLDLLNDATPPQLEAEVITFRTA